MLLNQHRLRAEIALRSQLLAQERQEVIAEIGVLRSRLKREATSPLTLGILFVAGLGVGLISKQRWLPRGMGWMLWRSGSPLFLSALSQWLHQLVGGRSDDDVDYDDDAAEPDS